MKGAFRQYMEDVDDGNVRSEDYYLKLEQDAIEAAYDRGYRDNHAYKTYNESYFEDYCLE